MSGYRITSIHWVLLSSPTRSLPTPKKHPGCQPKPLLLLCAAECPGPRGTLSYEHLDRLWKDRWLVGGRQNFTPDWGWENRPLHDTLSGPLHARKMRMRGRSWRQKQPTGYQPQPICFPWMTRMTAPVRPPKFTISSMEDSAISSVLCYICRTVSQIWPR